MRKRTNRIANIRPPLAMQQLLQRRRRRIKGKTNKPWTKKHNPNLTTRMIPMKNIDTDFYYARIREQFTQPDGTESTYNSSIAMMGPNELFDICDTCYIRSKSDLQKEIDVIIKRIWGQLDGVTCIETDRGFTYTRFVKWLNDDNFEIVKDGEHTDKEVYKVEVILIEQVTSPMKRFN